MLKYLKKKRPATSSGALVITLKICWILYFFKPGKNWTSSYWKKSLKLADMSDERLIKVLKNKKSFVITSHKHCDGDGLGAGCALAHTLLKLGKEVIFIHTTDYNNKYIYLEKDLNIQTKPDFEFKEDMCLLAVDVNDKSLIEPLFSAAAKKNCLIWFIDHHPLLKKEKEAEYFIQTQASSTGEIVFDVIKDLEVPLDQNISEALYTSIIFDTKCFRSIKNSNVPFLISAELIPHIPDVQMIYNHLFKNLTPKKLEFFKFLKNAEYFIQTKIGSLHLYEKDLKTHEADVGTACELLDMMMDISTLEFGVLIIENQNNTFKVSLRSKETNLIPLAEKLGGGGHNLSAGAYVKDTSYDTLKDKILNELKLLVNSK